jgi:prevent-host-death family protein
LPVETTYTSLRQRLASVLKLVADDHEVVIVRRRSAKDVALVPVGELMGRARTQWGEAPALPYPNALQTATTHPTPIWATVLSRSISCPV